MIASCEKVRESGKSAITPGEGSLASSEGCLSHHSSSHDKSKPFIRVEREVLKLKLSGTAFRVLLYLCDKTGGHWGEQQFVYVSIDEIAEAIGVGRRTVHKADEGSMAQRLRRGGSGGTVTRTRESNWRSPPRPGEKSAEHGRPYNREHRDLAKGESFGFLGFEFRRVRSRRGVWRPHYTPQTKRRTALLRKLKEIFRRYQSQPVGRVVTLINPILPWVGELLRDRTFEPVFGYVRDWVEKKIRRHMMRARHRRGFGWKRWSTKWLYERLGLYGKYYRSRWPPAAGKALPTGSAT